MRGCKKKAGHLGSLFFVKKKYPRNLCESILSKILRMKKKYASPKTRCKGTKILFYNKSFS